MPGFHSNDKVKQEVAAATGMTTATALPDPDDMATQEVAAAIGMPSAKPLADPDKMASHPVKEHHNPLDIPFGYEVNETHSIGSGLSGTNVKVDNSHGTKKVLERMSENVLKQLLETQIGECACKSKNRPKQ